MREIAFTVLLIALSACGSVPSEAPAPSSSAKPLTIPCVKASAWSKADQAALANALEPVKNDPVIARLVLDWQRMRGEAAACSAAQQ